MAAAAAIEAYLKRSRRGMVTCAFYTPKELSMGIPKRSTLKLGEI